MKCDLHIHTTHSDGSMSVGEVLDLAKYNGLECIAITDHDIVSGIEEAIEYGKQIGVKVIPGIEFSAYSTIPVHILGYNFDYKSEKLDILLQEILSKRIVRKDRILTKLREFKIEIDESKLPTINVGRSHIARELRNQGYVGSINEAFDRYLGENRMAYYPSSRLTPMRAVEIIAELGGQSVIAHPLSILKSKKLEMLIEGLKPYGLGGLECYYPNYSETEIQSLVEVAEKYGLFTTGGSDFHGQYKGTMNFIGACLCDLPDKLK